jgi:hypothetical protein
MVVKYASHFEKFARPEPDGRIRVSLRAASVDTETPRSQTDSTFEMKESSNIFYV